MLQLSHLPLSFCHLKALRWLDLKKNPLVPMLEGIAGPCGDNKQCEQCARDIVRTFTKAAIKVEEDRNRMLQKKLLEKGKEMYTDFISKPSLKAVIFVDNSCVLFVYFKNNLSKNI